MFIKSITQQDNNNYNKVVNHPLQSYEWGEFRERSGVKVIRRGIYDKDKLVDGFQLTIHPIPHIPWTIGYLPKGKLPTEDVLKELIKIAKENKCIFIQLEPNVYCHPELAHLAAKLVSGSPTNGNKMLKQVQHDNIEYKIYQSYHPLFTKYTFMLDLSKSEEELLKAMHPKARYNIRVAQKHGVEIIEDNSDQAFQKYLRLTEETTKRQSFFAHTRRYHEVQWQTLNHPKMENGKWKMENNLTSHLLVAKFKNKILAAWILFIFKDTLYYPYGASSIEHREVMASNLIMWESIRYGKKLGLKKFDMWGALGHEPDPKDPWFGFHDFKRKYGPEHVEFIGSYDLIINPILYQFYKLSDKLRWLYLRLRK